MLKHCVKLVHSLSTQGLLASVRLYTKSIQVAGVFRKMVGEVVVIQPSYQNLSTRFCDVYFVKLPLLKQSFTPFPQTLLLTTKKV